jgi:DNA primase
MSKIPQDFLATLMAGSNLLDLARERGITVKTMGSRAKALCPFHDEKSPSFTLDGERGFYHCFGCGVHGDAIAFVMAYDHLDFLDAVEYLANRLGLTVPRDNSTGNNQNQQQHKAWYALMDSCASFYQNELMRNQANQMARDYVKQRGLSSETCKRFQIGFAQDDWHNLKSQTIADYNEKDLLALGMLTKNDSGKVYDRFRGRLMFPIRDTLGRVRGFGGRILGEGQPKYLNSPDTELYHKHRLLYGLYEALQTQKQPDYMIVVEGYMDVVALAQYDIPLACATLGTATSTDHLRLLLRYTNQIIFCFDGDTAGKKAAFKALNISMGFMHDGKDIKFLFLPEGSDPDDFVKAQGKEAFLKLLHNAASCDEYLFTHLNNNYAHHSLAEKAHYAHQAQAIIKQVPKGLYQTMLTQRLAEKLDTTPEQLANMQTTDTAPAQAAPQQAKLQPNKTNGSLDNAGKCVHLLLHYPALAKNTEISDAIDTLRMQGTQKLLCYVAKALSEQEIANTAFLLRTIDNERLLTHLTQITHKPCTLTEEQAHQELLDGCMHLGTQNQKQHIHEMLELAKQRPLTDDERQLLKSLLEVVR